ncbi:nicotinic acid mononucleotide adenyltransferase [Formosa sp. PL04]|uniref:toxin-antitoxin system YwqK family antitoxin n=1 Tax=Formosa sp. PL04 TaxID=3081755 RepID=UPI0029828938|nr:nicotinic acid mononucleotide adenyltransferase [Formosa sp. PL04]MDW5289322.1 nicotinic acid mononucleotide adenyltransferase [Formosa sp. PL04]
MKTKIIFVLALLMSVVSFAQDSRDLKINEGTQLIEATYFHENGAISQTGFYTLDGKLQGEWKQFDADGKKIASANYNKGEKVGKWFFWNDDTLKEVDYSNNAIASVSEWNNKSKLAGNN